MPDPAQGPSLGAIAIETARRLIGAGQLGAAEGFLARVPPGDPALPQALALLAELHHHAGRADQAAAMMARLVAMEPAAPAHAANLALTLAGVGAGLEAAGALAAWHERAARLAPHDPRVLVNAATRDIAAGRGAEAWARLTRVLALDPARAEAHGGIGMIRAARADMGGALGPYARAVASAPEASFPRFTHAATLQALDRFEEAEAGFRVAADLKWRETGAPAATDPRGPRLGIGWKPGFDAGWDVYGANLVERAMARGIDPVIVNPIIAGPREGSRFDPLYRDSLAVVASGLARGGVHDFPVLVALGNDFLRFPYVGRGRREIGVIFLEDTRLTPAGRARADGLDLVIAGSTWGAEVLRGLGLLRVETVLQGIDPSLFNRARRPQRTGPFRLFSGGKLEFRKGQDLVIAAFKRFHARHPDTRLVIAWQSPWPMVARSIVWGGIIGRPPEIGPDHKLDLRPWLAAQGLPPHAVEVLDLLPNWRMPEILAGVHGAIFPNRCEGGTNLVAMEAMAAGVPVILSANTGHLDLIEGDNCIALTRQTAIAPPPFGAAAPKGTDGWGDSDLDEMVAAMEALYDDPAGAEAMGARGAKTLNRLTWAGQIDRLLAAIGPLEAAGR